MRVLIACEFSGVVRDAFRARGHDAVSCDLLPTEAPGPHIEGNVLLQLGTGWDLMIAHPPCTYLANAGVRWLHDHVRPKVLRPEIKYGAERWAAMRDAAAFFRALLDAPIPRVAVENPTMHRYARELCGPPSDAIHPHQFGHGETKMTYLWLRNLPPLLPTLHDPGRRHFVHEMSPSADRGKKRSVTFQGIADAMAAQWGSFR